MVVHKMPCDIDVANAQHRLWDIELPKRYSLSIESPIHSPNSSHGVQAIDKFTHSVSVLAPVRHKLRLILTLFVHPTDLRLVIKVSQEVLNNKA